MDTNKNIQANDVGTGGVSGSPRVPGKKRPESQRGGEDGPVPAVFETLDLYGKPSRATGGIKRVRVLESVGRIGSALMMMLTGALFGFLGGACITFMIFGQDFNSWIFIPIIFSVFGSICGILPEAIGLPIIHFFLSCALGGLVGLFLIIASHMLGIGVPVPPRTPVLKSDIRNGRMVNQDHDKGINRNNLDRILVTGATVVVGFVAYRRRWRGDEL